MASFSCRTEPSQSVDGALGRSRVRDICADHQHTPGDLRAWPAFRAGHAAHLSKYCGRLTTSHVARYSPRAQVDTLVVGLEIGVSRPWSRMEGVPPADRRPMFDLSQGVSPTQVSHIRLASAPIFSTSEPGDHPRTVMAPASQHAGRVIFVFCPRSPLPACLLFLYSSSSFIPSF
jgi:hypothetical protein